MKGLIEGLLFPKMLTFADEDANVLAGLVAPGTEGTGAPGTEGTGAAGTEGTGPAAEDPEYELEFGEEGKKEKKKIKLSELKKGYMFNDDYTKKTQNLSEEKEKIKDLLGWSENIKKDESAVKIILALSQKGLGNPEVLKRVLEAFEKVEEKKEVVSDEILGMEKELELMDEDSAEAKTLKRMISFSKGLLTRLDKAETDLKTQATTRVKDKEAATSKDQEALVAKATKTLNDTISALTDAEKGDLKFENDEAKGLWRQLVVSHLKDNPKEYKSSEDFVKTIQEVGKKFHSTLQKYGEGVVKKYLESKKGPVPPAGGAAGDHIPKPVTLENLQEGIEKELTNLEKDRK